MSLFVLLCLLLLCLPGALLAPCDDYAHDITGWSYVQGDPSHGNTNLSLSSYGTLIANTTTGYGLWLNYAPYEYITVTGAAQFSFWLRAKNVNSWNGYMPTVTLTDGYQNNITFIPYAHNAMPSDGVTWVQFSVSLNWQFRVAGNNFNPGSRIAGISIFTDTLDAGYTLELDNVTFRGADSCNFAQFGCRKIGVKSLSEWSYVQQYPWDGATEITINSNVVKINTTTGFGLWSTLSLGTPLGGDRFSFEMMGYNNNSGGWQGDFPHVILTDTQGRNATFVPVQWNQLLSTNGVTWNTFNVYFNGTNMPLMTSAISPDFDNHNIKNVTFFLDTWDAGFIVSIRNMYFDYTIGSCTLPNAWPDTTSTGSSATTSGGQGVGTTTSGSETSAGPTSASGSTTSPSGSTTSAFGSTTSTSGSSTTSSKGSTTGPTPGPTPPPSTTTGQESSSPGFTPFVLLALVPPLCLL